ncbi:MAG: hypothetical protein C5B52_03485 [Bacteroidetes bacterium]|nr:MAG: hypothetical protein C5B52_03485 [Bacteroidota bacterium]
MKKLCLLLLVSFFSFTVIGQTPALILQSEGGKLFIQHTVAPKENWYSIGRIYNISPKELAPYNGMKIDKVLSVGEMLKIPMTTANFAQAGTAGADEVFVPLYHVVSDKEGLYRIGQNYNKVKTENLKAWNGLKADEISSGQRLVVGYLKVKKSQSPLATSGIKKIGGAVPATEAVAVQTNPTVTQTEKPTVTNTKPADTNTKPVETVTPTGHTSVEGVGYFKAVYMQQNKNQTNLKIETGQGAIFKSTSGWQDAKYYALMNSVSPGTIVRITNPSTGKVIYAKVLGEIPPGKENEGLLVRISNAAAAELMVNEKEAKFPAEVGYVKE